MAETLKEYRERRIQELAADTVEPANMRVEDVLERAFDSALDFIRRNYLRELSALLDEVLRLSADDGISPERACEEIKVLVEDEGRRFSSELEDLEHWTDGWYIWEKEMQQASPDDLRKQGWAVAIHNDYKIPDHSCTFWLLTKKIGPVTVALKGEGYTDQIALNLIRDQVTQLEKQATSEGP